MPTELNLNDLIPAVIAAVAAAGGYGASRLQSSKPNPASSGSGDGGETLQAIERVGHKVDSVARQLASVKNVVDGLATDLDAAKHEIDRIKPDVAHALGRLAVLESRMLTNRPEGPI